MKSKIFKKRIINFFLMVAIVATSGCEKFLEEEDPSNLTPDGYYTIPEHAEAAIAAAYSNTRFISGGAGIFVQNFQMLEAVTGTVKTETGQNQDLNNLLGLAHNGDNVLVRNWWNGLYGVIAQTNLVLEKVPGINPMDAAQKKRILGEAQFLRAWSYFYLVRLFGDVPLITKPVDATSPDLLPSRTPKEDVYAQIVTDLQAAEAAGLPMTDASGRVSTGAAKSLLAEVYLTMAGQPLNKGASHYQLAATKAAEVINSGSFSLFPTYIDLHRLGQENKGEHIFQIQYHVGISTSSAIQAALLPNFKDISKIGTEIGSCVPTNQFYNSYEAGDVRKMDSVGFFYTSYWDQGFKLPKKNLSAPYIFKHFDSACHGVLNKEGSGEGSLNWPQIRYAQVLLTFAEAQNESGGLNTAAYNALKAIRDRAGLVTPLQATFNQATFREAVWKERWWELCFEGVSWFDMIRTKKVFNSVTKVFDNFAGHKFPDNPNATLADKHLLFPLPIAEMQNNPNLKPQNPGY